MAYAARNMVIWERVGKQARAVRGALSYPRIAEAAVALADEEGLDAVSMRKVAARLGSGTMSLYRYVDSRDDLVHLMADAVYGEARVPERSGDWRRDLAGLARGSRAVALRHPWLAGHSTSMDSLGPNQLGLMEAAFTLLVGYGLDIGRGWDVWGTVQAFVEGFVLEEAAAARTGLSKREWRDGLLPYLRLAFASGKYPMAERAIHESVHDRDADEVFARRLDHVLTGLAPVFEAAGDGR